MYGKRILFWSECFNLGKEICYYLFLRGCRSVKALHMAINMYKMSPIVNISCTHAHVVQAYQQGVRYPQYLFLVYPFHSVIADWWVGTAEEQEELMEMFAGCTASQRESVLPFTLSPLLDEFISDESIIADSGIVRIDPCVGVYLCLHAEEWMSTLETSMATLLCHSQHSIWQSIFKHQIFQAILCIAP